MPEIQFSHTLINRTLTVSTGANQISWGYNLNTQSYPTYGGEVVQVLSTNIDDLQVTGEIRLYKEMEEIYRWFLEYMQLATQGPGSSPQDGYREEAVVMKYPERGWTLSIQPKSLPSMTYGRDVVIPSWTLIAAIKDPDPAMSDLTLDSAVNGDVANWQGTVSADIGFRQSNPFSDPQGTITTEEKALFPNAPNQVANGKTVNDSGTQLTGLAKQMQGAFNSLLSTGNLADIFEGWQDVLKPITPAGDVTQATQDKAVQ